MDFLHHLRQRNFPRLKVFVCNIGKNQSVLLVFAANHVYFSTAKRALTVEKHFENVGDFCHNLLPYRGRLLIWERNKHSKHSIG